MTTNKNSPIQINTIYRVGSLIWFLWFIILPLFFFFFFLSWHRLNCTYEGHSATSVAGNLHRLYALNFCTRHCFYATALYTAPISHTAPYACTEAYLRNCLAGYTMYKGRNFRSSWFSLFNLILMNGSPELTVGQQPNRFSKTCSVSHWHCIVFFLFPSVQ